MHTNSKLLFQKRAREFFRPGMRILEIGPDQFPSTYLLFTRGRQFDHVGHPGYLAGRSVDLLSGI